MKRFQTADIDHLEILPPSSTALKEKVDCILNQSLSYSAAVASFDPQTGTYRIVLQGTLPDRARLQQHAA